MMRAIALFLLAATALACVLLRLASAGAQDTEVDIWTGLREAPPWIDPLAAPATHDDAWRVTHGNRAGEGGDDACGRCHDESWCGDCHAAGASPVAVHHAGWFLLHGSSALSSGATCGSCHVPATFCRDCHSRTRGLSEPGFDPPVVVDLHPAGWLDPVAPDRHSLAARRNLSSCASCHTGEDCLTCHVSISPHGSDFSGDAERLSELAAPMCERCHANDRAR